LLFLFYFYFIFITFKGLEQASQLYFGEHNAEAAIERLAPLHQMIEVGSETLAEAAFQQQHSRDLQEAQEWISVFFFLFYYFVLFYFFILLLFYFLFYFNFIFYFYLFYRNTKFLRK
jgi:hypothetical protein